MVDLLKRALTLAPSVVDDANAWWDLPRLFAHVRAHPEVTDAPGATCKKLKLRELSSRASNS